MFSLQRLPLDPSVYDFQDDELAFFKAQTGIQNDEELREHILGVQAEAYAVYPFPCIRRFDFVTMQISKSPSYDAALRIGRETPDAILLDLGCCLGNDARRIIADGYPLKNVMTTDIHDEFWTLGHKLFRSSQDSFPVSFLQGDIFDPKFLAPGVLPAPSSSTPPPAPLLPNVASLTELQHRISVLHASCFFHLFSETQQHDLAHLLGSLLSPLPGSMIFGSQIGVMDTENRMTPLPRLGVAVFGHSPLSWEKLWVGEGGVFKPEDVMLSTRVLEKDLVWVGADPGVRTYMLVWSITRA